MCYLLIEPVSAREGRGRGRGEIKRLQLPTETSSPGPAVKHKSTAAALRLAGDGQTTARLLQQQSLLCLALVVFVGSRTIFDWLRSFRRGPRSILMRVWRVSSWAFWYKLHTHSQIRMNSPKKDPPNLSHSLYIWKCLWVIHRLTNTYGNNVWSWGFPNFSLPRKQH